MIDNNAIYDDEFAFCRPYLVNGENILWKGKPEKKNILTAYDIFLIPFSILWCGFAFFWEISVILSDTPISFAIFGIPFIFAGLYFVFGRFILISYLRKRTSYVITNKKIIRQRGKKIDILDGKTMPPMYVKIYKNGNGTIQFTQNLGMYNTMNRMYSNCFGFGNYFMLENIADVIHVQQIINTMDR